MPQVRKPQVLPPPFKTQEGPPAHSNIAYEATMDRLHADHTGQKMGDAWNQMLNLFGSGVNAVLGGPEVKNTGTPEKPLFQAVTKFEPQVAGVTAPEGFFSHAENVLAGTKQGQWIAKDLFNYLKSKGVRDEELRWSGLQDLLQGNNKISREAVQQHLAKAPGVELRSLSNDTKIQTQALQQKVLSNNIEMQRLYTQRNVVGEDALIPEIESELDRLHNQNTLLQGEIDRLEESGHPQYEQPSLVLPGPYENYREQLLIHKPYVNPDQKQAFGEWLEQKRGYSKEAANQTVLEALQGHPISSRIEDEWRKEVSIGVPAKFSDSHHQVDDLIAHLRLNERYLSSPSPPYPEYGVFDRDGNELQRFGSVGDAERFKRSQGNKDLTTLYVDPLKGEKVLHADEYQSDWSNAGRRKGFKDPIAIKKYEEDLKRYEETVHNAYASKTYAADLKQYNKETYGISNRAELDKFLQERSGAYIRDMGTQPNTQLRYQVRDNRGHHTMHATEEQAKAEIERRLKQQWEFLQDEYDSHLRRKLDALRPKEPGGIESGPFVEGSWPELAAKQHLLEAARDPDVQYVTWTTGEQQAERYQLDKHLDSIEYSPTTNILAYKIKAGRYDSFHDTIDLNKEGKTLDEAIGKELAAKLLKEPPISLAFPGKKNADGTTYREQIHRLRGGDLKIENKGKREFYDRIMPQSFKKLTKQEPQQIKIQSGMQTPTQFNQRDFIDWLETNHLPTAEAWSRLPSAKQSEYMNQYKSELANRGQKVWSIKLTPELRKQILEKGFPLYSIAPIMALSGRAKKRQEAKPLPPPPKE